MKKISTLILFLFVMSLATIVSAHDINQAGEAPQYQMLDANDGQPPVDPTHKNKRRRPAPQQPVPHKPAPHKPVPHQPEPQQPIPPQPEPPQPNN
ncbi:MAG: hypothetical protein H6Q74_2749 [Firmicutes bacterium]|nr:hypothetical protein [Bacillota bacterium]